MIQVEHLGRHLRKQEESRGGSVRCDPWGCVAVMSSAQLVMRCVCGILPAYLERPVFILSTVECVRLRDNLSFQCPQLVHRRLHYKLDAVREGIVQHSGDALMATDVANIHCGQRAAVV